MFSEWSGGFKRVLCFFLKHVSKFSCILKRCNSLEIESSLFNFSVSVHFISILPHRNYRYSANSVRKKDARKALDLKFRPSLCHRLALNSEEVQ